MIRITKERMIAENNEDLLGVCGGENGSQRCFLIENLTLQAEMVFRAYLQFDDGSCNFFVLNALQEGDNVKLVWDIQNHHIRRSGLIKLKIKCFVGDDEVFCTPVGKFIASNSFEIDRQADMAVEISEVADIERKLNLIQTASQKPPIIAENGNWLLYNFQENEYQDSHFPSKGDKGDKGDRGECGVNIVEPNSIEFDMLDENLRSRIDNLVSQEFYIPEKTALLSAIQTSNQNIQNLSDKVSELADMAIKYKDSDNVVTSWADVQRIVRAGMARDVFEVGEQLVCNHAKYGTMTWNIIGIDQENLSDTNYSHSMTLQLDKGISNNNLMLPFDSTGTSNVWESSTIRAWLNGEFFDNLDDDFKAVVAQTQKLTEGNQTADKVFLLSTDEVGRNAVGLAYEFYQEDSFNRRNARGNYWLLRTPDSLATHIYMVMPTGNGFGNNLITKERRIIPACCIM